MSQPLDLTIVSSCEGQLAGSIDAINMYLFIVSLQEVMKLCACSKRTRDVYKPGVQGSD